MNDIPDMEWIEGLSDSRAVEFIKIFRPDFRQSIKKIGNLKMQLFRLSKMVIQNILQLMELLL